MSQNSVINENDIESIQVESVATALSTWIEQGTKKVIDFWKSDEVSDTLAEANELGADLSKVFKIVHMIRKFASIPDKLFMRKMERFCAGLVSIPYSKRDEYVARVGKDALNKDSVFILGILNRLEEMSKIDIFVRLFEAKINEEIDEQTYRRMMLQVDRTMYSDILFLKDSVCSEYITIKSAEQENLLATGWLIFAGLGIGSSDEEGDNLYLYTQTAKQFSNIVFQSDRIDAAKENVAH